MNCCTCCAQEFSRLADAMVANRATEAGPRPPNMIDAQWSFLGPVVLDSVSGGGELTQTVSGRPDIVGRAAVGEEFTQMVSGNRDMNWRGRTRDAGWSSIVSR